VPAAPKTALLSAPSSAAVRSTRPGVAAGQHYAGALGASPAGRLEPDPGAAADHDDGLPGQFRLALAGSGGHDSLPDQVVARWCRTGRAQPWHLSGDASRGRGAAVPPSQTNSPMTMAATAQGAAMTIITGW
jgi:hypothetical protein